MATPSTTTVPHDTCLNWQVDDFDKRLSTAILTSLNLESVVVMCGGQDGEMPVVWMKWRGQETTYEYSLDKAGQTLIDLITAKCEQIEYWTPDEGFKAHSMRCRAVLKIHGIGLKIIKQDSYGPTYLAAILRAYNKCLLDLASLK